MRNSKARRLITSNEAFREDDAVQIERDIDTAGGEF